MQEVSTERFPHFGIPGFEKLPRETQDLYLKIPADRLEAVRPIIENEITKTVEGKSEEDDAQSEKAEAQSEETTAANREAQSSAAVETFHRAENGDPDAKKDLMDAKKELLGEEPSDDEIFQTILEDQSGLFDNETVLEVALSDEETQQHQDVLNLFKEFRGDLPSVDAAIPPAEQIELFIQLTKAQGNLAERMHFARQALTALTASGKRSLFEGMTEFHILDGGKVSETGVDKLKTMVAQSQQNEAA